MGEKVLVGIPTHGGDISVATIASLQYASSAKNFSVASVIQGLSLLARNFNTMFCKAISNNFEYFVLLHSDIGVRVQGGLWIEYMVQELNDRKLDALAAIPPIKNAAGLTSTGIVVDSGNMFGIKRLTMKQLADMPDVFYRGDMLDVFGLDAKIAGPFLVNTGCIIMRCAPFAGKRWEGFRIHDEIAWTKRGLPKSYTIPEDWLWSHWMHKNGMKYAATKELLIDHVGTKSYCSYDMWGVDEDDGEMHISPNEWRERE